MMNNELGIMFRKVISFALNLPYTIFGLLFTILSGAKKVQLISNSLALVFHVQSLWWWPSRRRGTRAMAIGNVVLLGPRAQSGDLAHELVHVGQYTKLPLIFPLLYFKESLLRGYRKNKYEIEAYRRTGNKYINS